MGNSYFCSFRRIARCVATIPHAGRVRDCNQRAVSAQKLTVEIDALANRVVESRSGAVAAVAAPFPDPAHQTGRAVLASGFRTRVNELSPTARWCENGLSGSIRASHEDMRPDSGAARYP